MIGALKISIFSCVTREITTFVPVTVENIMLPDIYMYAVNRLQSFKD